MNFLIDWFARNRVAANLLMMLIIALGLLTLPDTRKELLPNVSLERISIAVLYPGASSVEVESLICTRIENAIYDLESIIDLTSLASEGLCSVTADVVQGFESRVVLDDIKSRVEAISTFPEGTSKPIIKELQIRNRVAKLIISGVAEEWALKKLAEDIRSDLLALPVISVVDIENVRPYEISIEVSDKTLDRYDINFNSVVAAVKDMSVDMPGGTLKTDQGDVLIQANGKIDAVNEFEDIILRASADGGRITLSDLGTINDGFQRGGSHANFDGASAVSLDIYRVGNQDIIEVAQTIADYVAQPGRYIPEGINLFIWKDDSKLFKGRIDLLLSNALSGLALVFLILVLFLNWRLSFWVSLGIPISFLGALWVLPMFGGSINIISLFAFLLVLGIVVDDAIVVGESVFSQHSEGDYGLNGAILGTQKVAKPIVFAVLTTIIAFLPLLFLPGPEGKLMQIIPIVVIATLVFSLIESLFILPLHLSHIGPQTQSPTIQSGKFHRLLQLQSNFSVAVESFIHRVYKPFLAQVLRWRWAYLALFCSTFLIFLVLLTSGWLRVVLFSSIEADIAVANISFAEGTHADITKAALQRIESAALSLKEELRDENGHSPINHVFSVVGPKTEVSNVDVIPKLDHLGSVSIELSSATERETSGHDIVNKWREKVGDIQDSISLTFSADLIPPEPDINIELSGDNLTEIAVVAETLKKQLARFTGVYDIQDSQRIGKPQVILSLKPVARDLGLTMMMLGQQVHQAFHGVNIQSIQRGEDEVKVVIRYPDEATRSLWSLENMRIQLPNGDSVPLFSVADVSLGAVTSTIKHYERKKVITVSAFVDRTKQTPRVVMEQLEKEFLAQLSSNGEIQWNKAGKQKSIDSFISILMKGYLLALLGMYLLMAVLFSSYGQPLIIMFAIPFGLVGSLFGHMLLGIDVTIWSLIGMVAVSGVVVNDNLVLVDYINQKREQGENLLNAIQQAGVERFRPIILTSLTTFIGLMPLIVETSLQAQFLIPMAVSLAFGVLFATLISLVLVPATYYILNDLRSTVTSFSRRLAPLAVINEITDTVEIAYQHGFDLAERNTSENPENHHRYNPYKDDVLASGWEAGWQDAHQQK